MSARRVAAIALSGALAAGGAGAAIAAVTKDDAEKAEQSILDDAAKRLDVTPEKLRDALGAAQDAQLERAVRDGLLTAQRADAIKAARKRSGRVLGGPFGGPRLHGGRHPPFAGPRLHGGRGHGGPGLRGFGVRRGLFGDIAEALGTTPAKLVQELRAGKSVADIAKANGKSLDDVRAAVKAALKTRLDKAVKDGDLPRRRADAIREHVDEQIERLDLSRPLLPRRHRRGAGPPPGALRPGGFTPGDGPDLVAPGGTYS